MVIMLLLVLLLLLLLPCAVCGTGFSSQAAESLGPLVRPGSITTLFVIYNAGQAAWSNGQAMIALHRPQLFPNGL